MFLDLVHERTTIEKKKVFGSGSVGKESFAYSCIDLFDVLTMLLSRYERKREVVAPKGCNIRCVTIRRQW